MTQKTQKIIVSRFDPGVDQAPHFQIFDVPVVEKMKVLQALDYIYEYLDGTLAYYDHGACTQGICKRCMLLIDGKPDLMCQTKMRDGVKVEPLPKFKTVKDLVYDQAGRD
jgi:fumarate reductase iron-sulfur subunit